jgi:tripartite-type tricarboxylate transporter receptor subunit TctC
MVFRKAVLFAALAAISSVAAAQNWPTKPVRLVISFTPGSSTDIIGRAVTAKHAPGSLNFASAGVGSGTHFNLEKLMLVTGTNVTHIPYKGTPEAIADTIAGRTCCYWAPLNAALQSPDLKGRLMKLGTEPGNLSLDQFSAFIGSEVAETQKILQAAGIKPQ